MSAQLPRQAHQQPIERHNREAGSGLDCRKEKLLRLARGISLALPVAAAFFVASCTSTGSNLGDAGNALAPSVTAPSMSFAPTGTDGAPNAANSTAPQQPGAVAQQYAANSQTVTLATTNNPAETLKLASAAPNALPIPSTPDTIQSPAPVIALPGDAATPVPGSNEALIAAAAKAAASQPTVNPAAVALDNVDPARFGNGATGTAAAAGAQAGSGQVLTAAPAPATLEAAPVKKKSIFGNLFASQPKAAKPAVASADTNPAVVQLALADPTAESPVAKAAVAPVMEPAKLQLTSLQEPANKATQTMSDAPEVDNGDLPGVRKGALFEIKRRDSLKTDEDVDIGETDGGPVLLASAAGLARLAPNGLKVQRESVDVACLKPQLVKMLKQIEGHYGRSVVVTSGYRSPGYNRRVRGAKNSLHMFCAAADIEVAGVSKWELAKYARSMANRGGVGTYCHTEAVHVDVGPNRDWNWRCSRR